MLFALRENHLSLVDKGIRRIMGAFDTDGDRRPETLLGQRFDPVNFFGRSIRKMVLENGRLALAPNPLALPMGFTVIGGTLADLTGSGALETIYVKNGVLHIHEGRQLFYRTSKSVGGSLSRLTYDIDPTAKTPKSTTAVFEIAPDVADLDHDGRPELLAAASQQSQVTIPSVGAGIDQPRMAVFRYRNGRFEMGNLGHALEGSVQGLTMHGNQVYFVVSNPGSELKADGRSHLLAYVLAEP